MGVGGPGLVGSVRRGRQGRRRRRIADAIGITPSGVRVLRHNLVDCFHGGLIGLLACFPWDG